MEYLGYDVLEIEPDGAGMWQENWPENLYDLATPGGVSHSLSKKIVPNINRPFLWFLESRAAVQQFRDWFDDRKGRHTPFWVPTWRWDLVASRAVVNDVDIFVHNVEFEHLLTDTRRHLAFITSAIDIRPIDSTTYIGAVEEQITLFDPVSVNAGQPIFVLAFCRLLNDNVEVEWHNTRLATVELRFLELVDETPEFVPPPPPVP